MYKAFFASKQFARWAYGVGAIIVGLNLVNAYLNTLWAHWQNSFWKIMGDVSHHTIDQFHNQLSVFAGIAFAFIVLGPVSTFVTSHYTFRWRKALTDHYLSLWCDKNKEIEGEAQRIQEDPARLAITLESLVEQVFGSVIMLAVFLPQLWHIGEKVRIEWVAEKLPPFLNWTSWIFSGQGGLMKVAFIAAILGTIISRLVGWKLKHIQYENQVVEAALRRELELAVGKKPIHGLLARLTMLFTGLSSNYYRLYLHVGGYNLWKTSFGQWMIIVPYILIGPVIFAGHADTGDMQEVATIFGIVIGSLTIFIDNWRIVTEFQSIRIRLREFLERLYSNED